MIKYVITGTRSLQTPSLIEPILEQHLTEHLTTHNPEDILLIHGGCKGVDLIAKKYAEKLGIPTKVYTAEWSKHGKAAGPIRNRKMLEENTDAIVLAFPSSESRGTINCINQVKKIGMLVYRYPVEQLNEHDEVNVR